MIVYDSARKPVNLGAELHHGGEGAIYAVHGRPGSVAKIFAPAPPADYARKLTWMRANPPTDPGRALGHASIAWPGELVYDAKGSLSGYLMPLIANAAPILDVFNPRRRAQTLPRFDRRYLHRAARNLAAAIGALHECGYVVGDLNESNVLVTPAALVTLIDADSFQVRGRDANGSFSFPCPVGKPEYTPPELQGRPFKGVTRLPEHDCFGLGVLIFQLLMEGSHPFRAHWLGKDDPPSIEERIVKGWFPHVKTLLSPVAPPPNTPTLNTLYPELVYLVVRCFVDGQRNPDLRPLPREWEEALRDAEQALIACPNGHFYSNHLAACPECGAANPRSRAAAAPTREPRREPRPTRTPLAQPEPAAAQRSDPQVRMRERAYSPIPPPAGVPAAQSSPAPQRPAAAQPVSQTQPAPVASVPMASAPMASAPRLPQLSALLARLTPRVPVDSARAGVLTWFIWSLTNATSWPVAFLIGESVRAALGGLVEYAAIGAVIGAAQWLALRGRVRLASGWALATGAGFFLGLSVDRSVGTSPLWPITCVLLGLLQWRFLRERVSGAHWWIMASAAGWVCGLGMAQFVPGGMFLAGLVDGAISGIVLALLVTRPRWFAGAQAISWRATAILLALVLLGIAGANAMLQPCSWLDEQLGLSWCRYTLRHPAPVQGVAFSPDGARLASFSADNIVRLWRVKDGTLLSAAGVSSASDTVMSGGLPGAQADLTFSKDDMLLAFVADGVAQLWRQSDGVRLSIPVHPAGQITGTAQVSSVRLSPEGSMLALAVCQASASAGQRCAAPSVRLHRTSDGSPSRVLQGQGGPIDSMAFTSDGKILATASCTTADNEAAGDCAGAQIRLWQVKDGKLLRVLTTQRGAACCLAFSQDGAEIAAGSSDRSVLVWRVADGALLQVLQHNAPIHGVAFAQNGAWLIAGSDPLGRWQASDGAPLDSQRLPGPASQPMFSLDGTTLATVDASNRVVLWQVR